MLHLISPTLSNCLWVYILQLFDRKFVDAVLNEWQKTMMDLPAGLRQAYEMVKGLIRLFALFLCKKLDSLPCFSTP